MILRVQVTEKDSEREPLVIDCGDCNFPQVQHVANELRAALQKGGVLVLGPKEEDSGDFVVNVLCPRGLWARMSESTKGLIEMMRQHGQLD